MCAKKIPAVLDGVENQCLPSPGITEILIPAHLTILAENDEKSITLY
jgi:hypothetical protein